MALIRILDLPVVYDLTDSEVRAAGEMSGSRVLAPIVTTVADRFGRGDANDPRSDRKRINVYGGLNAFCGALTVGVRGALTTGVRGALTTGVRGALTTGVRGALTTGVRGALTSGGVRRKTVG